MRTATLLAALLVAAAAPAPGPVAPGQQPLQPTRDVTATYVVEGQAATLVPGGIPGPVKLSWDAAGQRVRVEVAGRSQVALLDLRTHAAQAIDTTLRVVLPIKMRPSDLQPLTLENARLTPAGKDRVAGLACTLYTVEGGGRTGTVCLTADGVPLSGKGDFSGRPGVFKATAISYGKLPDELFTVPTGYMALGGAAGALAGALGSGGGGGGNLDLRSLGTALLGRGK